MTFEFEKKTKPDAGTIPPETELLLPAGSDRDEKRELLKDFVILHNLYHAAAREAQAKLQILDDEFQALYARNPVHHIESRLKSPRSIAGKLAEKGLAFSAENAARNIFDIAGIRVICCYIQDVYTIASLLLSRDDIMVLDKKDYIEEPKANGYRSLHLLVSVPVFLSAGGRRVPVEIQIRTIAMDFWASLEHQIGYKTDSPVDDGLRRELKDCADEISAIDRKMQDIYGRMGLFDNPSGYQTNGAEGAEKAVAGAAHFRFADRCADRFASCLAGHAP